jgi:hypothetical protein
MLLIHIRKVTFIQTQAIEIHQNAVVSSSMKALSLAIPIHAEVGGNPSMDVHSHGSQYD